MELLRKARLRVAQSMYQLPRYMCTETVDRSIFESESPRPSNVSCDEDPARPATHLATTDRLRLDVGMAAAVEMYSWVGEQRFNDRDLLAMVKEGAISTGSFAGFLNAIFRTSDSTFTYNGDTSFEGHEVCEFGFAVPFEKSHYFYGSGLHRVITAYSGTFRRKSSHAISNLAHAA